MLHLKLRSINLPVTETYLLNRHYLFLRKTISPSRLHSTVSGAHTGSWTTKQGAATSHSHTRSRTSWWRTWI